MSWKTCLHRYKKKRFHSCYRVSQSLYNWLSILTLVIWPKNIRSHNGCTSYIYFQTLGIYTSSLRITVPRKVLIAKIWGLMPLNTSFMIKLGLKIVIIAKMIYSVKVKMCQFVRNAQIHTHLYLNQYTARCSWQSMAASSQLKKGYFGGRVNLMPVLLLWLPTLWL